MFLPHSIKFSYFILLSSPPRNVRFLLTFSEPTAQTNMSDSGPIANNGENSINGIHPVNGVGSGGPASHNVTEAQQQQQMQQQPMANGVPHGYPYPPPPGSGFTVGPPPEMYQGDSGASGPRMMPPMHYPYPPQPGHQGPPVPPTGYVFPTMMPPPPPNGGVSPSSPTSPMSMQPYPPYGMWYPHHPGMQMQPPPGMVPQNGMQPVPMPMGTYPQTGFPPNAQSNGEKQPSTDGNAEPQQMQANGQPGGLSWVPGPGGLPPKEVAKNIPCRSVLV